NSQQFGLGEQRPGSGKAAEAAVRGEHAMTRDDDGNGISGEGLADGAGLGGTPHGFSEFAVGPSFPRGNLKRGFVDLPSKRLHIAEVQSNISKVLKFATKVLADFLDHLCDCRRCVRSTPAGLSRDALFGSLRSCFRELEAGDSEAVAAGRRLGPREAAGAERRFKEAVRCSLHRNSLTATSCFGQPSVTLARVPGREARRVCTVRRPLEILPVS